MKIIVANNKSLETHNLITQFIRIFTVPILNNLPSSFIKKIMRKSSKDAGSVIERAASAHALEIIYTRHERNLFSRGFAQGIADMFWHHIISQAKALRNRLKIVEDNLTQEIINISNNNNGEEIVILSVAGGSLRAVIHSIKKIHEQNINHKIKVINIDKDRDVLELGNNLAKNFGVEDKIAWINDKATNIKSLIPPQSIDIAEIVGLLDYFSEEKVIEVIKQIYGVLKNNGLLIVGNVHPNSESPFIKKTGWPQMYYRKPDDLSRVLQVCGFPEVEIIFEPLRVHIIALARK